MAVGHSDQLKLQVEPEVQNEGDLDSEALNLSLFFNYLSMLVPATTSISRSTFDANLTQYQLEWEQAVANFITNESEPALFISISPQSRISNEIHGDDVKLTVGLSIPSDTAQNQPTLAIIKSTSSKINLTIPLPLQITCLTLFLGQGYTQLHKLFTSAITPYFDRLAGESGSSHKPISNSVSTGHRSDALIPSAKKKVAELQLSLLQLHQNVSIPNVSLVVHPTIQYIVTKAQLNDNNVQLTPDLLNFQLNADPTLLNSLHATVNGWIKQIQTVTNLVTSDDDLSYQQRSASQEVNFWLVIESVLDKIEGQINSPAVKLTIDVLKNAKRFHATVSFVSETGITATKEIVSKYNLLMRDFPIDDLLTSVDLDRAQESIAAIFEHLCKRLRSSPYPIKRALPLVEAISQDLSDVLCRLLAHSPGLIQQDYHTFQRTLARCRQVLGAWDSHLKDFINIARDVMRKRQEKLIPIKIVARHDELSERLAYLADFRDNHQSLLTISQFNGSDDVLGLGQSVVDEITSAWTELRNVDPLDLSQGKSLLLVCWLHNFDLISLLTKMVLSCGISQNDYI